ncbi:hypothetical protein [Pseudescherichia sp.]|uniref:hypothetical protein n=1 Tax=Pseudescherichia sp. TaxID=2055881 RepID=UPI0028A16404|nr:hypothetical protein [Pseudescherichia sp.]
MGTTERLNPVQDRCRSPKHARQGERERAVQIPASWQLTAAQKAFIDSFADDKPKK